MEQTSTLTKRLVPLRIFSVIYIFVLTARYILSAIIGGLSKQSNINKLKKNWAADILQHLNIDVSVENLKDFTPDGKPVIFVGNHISYIDIPLILSVHPHISFVSKKEILYWPIIGWAAKIIDTVFVDRQSQSSRISAKNQIAEQMKYGNRSIVLFPSGTTTVTVSSKWKRGAFEIANQNEWRIVPFRITYSPIREHAYIDDDNFLVHLFMLFDTPNKKVHIEFHDPIEVFDIRVDLEKWKLWCEADMAKLKEIDELFRS